MKNDLSGNCGLQSNVSYAGLSRAFGKCTEACPQNIPIPDRLKEVSREMELMMNVMVPVLKGGLWFMDQLGHIRLRFLSR
jgi:L-lactate utilization protein LutB